MNNYNHYAKIAGFNEQELIELKEYFLEFEKLNKEINFFEALSDKLFDNEYDIGTLCDDLKETAKKSSLTLPAFYLTFYLANLEKLYKNYQKNGVEDWIYKDTVSGIRSKCYERKIIDDKLGIDSVSWFVEFFRQNRFGLGRLEFNLLKFPLNEYSKCGITVKKGDTVVAVHIPARGKLTKELRIDAYKKAYNFYRAKGEFKDGIMKALCNSWMLYPEYIKIYSKNSNLYDFSCDFDVFDATHSDIFHDGWRIFGGAFNNELKNLPNNTSLQRTFIDYAKNVGKYGEGYGMFFFDGEKIINK